MKISKESICQILLECKERNPGMRNLVNWLENPEQSDYFTAPASTKFHCNYAGGLAEHSWNVYDLLIKKNEQYQTSFSYDTLAICGLLHDICKVNYYKMQIEEMSSAQSKYLVSLYGGKLPTIPGPWNKAFASRLIEWKVNQAKPKPEYTPGQWVIEDQFPVGHGEKSVIMLQRFFPLYDEEIFAIRWHMSTFENVDKYAYNKALEKSMLVTMLFTADMEATNIIERKSSDDKT